MYAYETRLPAIPYVWQIKSSWPAFSGPVIFFWKFSNLCAGDWFWLIFKICAGKSKLESLLGFLTRKSISRRIFESTDTFQISPAFSGPNTCIIIILYLGLVNDGLSFLPEIYHLTMVAEERSECRSLILRGVMSWWDTASCSVVATTVLHRVRTECKYQKESTT